MSAAAEVITHLRAAMVAAERVVFERVASEEEIRDLILKVNELTVRLRGQEEE